MMKTHALRIAIAVLLVHVAAASPATAQVSVGLKISDSGRHNFHLAVGAHFGVPETRVVAIRARGIPDDDLPVVFFLATHAHVEPAAIVQLRLGGRSWMQISAHYGLGVELFHVPVTVDVGPPYGRALGHFKHRKRSEWHTIQLSDQDVAHLVSVKFMAKHYGCSANDVLRFHVKGGSVLHLHANLHKAKGGPSHLKIQGGNGASVKAGSGKLKVKGSGGASVKVGPSKVKVGGSSRGAAKPRGGGRGRGRR